MPDQILRRAIRRLHVGLGHASAPDLVRILRHGGASATAMAAARALECDICKGLVRPKIPRMHTGSDLPRPLHRIAMDVKYLVTEKGKDAPTRPCLNIIDLGSVSLIWAFRGVACTGMVH